MSERFHDIAVTVNGEDVRERVDARKTLVDFLRETLALTGTPYRLRARRSAAPARCVSTARSCAAA